MAEMKEIVFISLSSVIFIILSLIVGRSLVKLSWFYFICASLLYLIGTWGYVELVRQIELSLREHGINFEFGHSGILMVEVSLIYVLLSILNISIIAIVRIRKSKKA